MVHRACVGVFCVSWFLIGNAAVFGQVVAQDLVRPADAGAEVEPAEETLKELSAATGALEKSEADRLQNAPTYLLEQSDPESLPETQNGTQATVDAHSKVETGSLPTSQPVVKHRHQPHLRRDIADSKTLPADESLPNKQPLNNKAASNPQANDTTDQAPNSNSATKTPALAPASANASTVKPAQEALPIEAPPSLPNEPSPVTEAEIQQQLELVTTVAEVSDEQKTAATTLLKQALQWLSEAKKLDKTREQMLGELSQLDQKKVTLESRLRETVSPIEVPNLETVSLDAVAATATEAADNLKLAQETREHHLQRSETFNTIRKQRVQREQELKEQLSKLEKEAAAKPVEGTPPILVNATRIETVTHLKLVKAQLSLFQAEVDLAAGLVEVEPLQNDLDQREIARLTKANQIWSDALAHRRQIQSRHDVAESQRLARETDPALRKLAVENAELAKRQANYTDLIRQKKAELLTLQSKFKEQETSFKNIQDMVNDVGMTDTIGVILRSQLHRLIPLRPLHVRAKDIARMIPDVELEWLQLKEERDAMYDVAQLTDQHLGMVNESLFERVTPDEARELVRELLESRKKYLAQLLVDIRTYETTITDLNRLLANTFRTTRNHQIYISEHVHWIRSTDEIGLEDIDNAKKGILVFLDPSNWLRLVSDVGKAIQSRPWLSGAAFFILAIGMIVCDRLKDSIQAIGESKEVQAAYRFRPTIQAFLGTVMLALFLPSLFYLSGMWLEQQASVGDLTLAIASALRSTSIMWLALSFAHHSSRQHGLGGAHFGWHQKNLAVLRRNLYWLIAVGLPLVFVVMVIGAYQDGAWHNSLGRIAFMAGMVMMSVFMHQLLNPYRKDRGVWANRKVWLYQGRYVLHAAGIAMPIGLALLAAVGYVYSAYQLAYRAQLSLWLVVVVVVTQAMVSRYLMIMRRKTAMRHKQRRRQEQADAPDGEVVAEEELDFQDIGLQLQRLVRGCVLISLLLGTIVIWFDMIPALRMLDRVPLWSSEVTLADGLLCVLCMISTVVAARNLPGLLNITVLERLPLDFGTRYALTTVTRYLIALLGGVSAFYLIGVTWGSVQWLVAAMTVGLGFGLQEIFANFVSGLIILTERPIRVGDMVTVGGITGKVTRIQIRATTITDFDRREMVIPNKRFITEDVVNWTLSDPITRLVLPVGIAYEADAELARSRLLQLAEQHPLVLADPAPTAIFMGFGESTLDLELRIFMMGRDQAFEVRDELNRAINQSFKAANIEIAFPQRDLRIRTVDAKTLLDTAQNTKPQQTDMNDADSQSKAA